MLKPFELFYLGVEGFLPPLHRKIRGQLLDIARPFNGEAEILDVGGRKSHYTIGVPARVTLSDVPRESDVQKQLNLGINNGMVHQTQRRRSNISKIVFDDMTCSKFADQTFDVVVAVEVLEHVEEDAKFVGEVCRVLKPGGTFLMSTPNGDFVENHNVDHKRHYRRQQLHDLLAGEFEEVQVQYAIQGGMFRSLGLRSWSPKRPVGTLLSMVGNVVNSWQSASARLAEQAVGTRHLIAMARRSR